MSSPQDFPVVVGVDGSDSALTAVVWAARHASRGHLPLRIVHAFDWPLIRGSARRSRWSRTLRAEAWGLLEEARTQAYAIDTDLDVGATLQTSFSVPLLLRESDTASLVVVGTHGHGSLSGLVIGSTGVELAARATAPVVIVRGRSADEISAAAPVLVGYDGSPASDLAVAAGLDYAATHGRSVRLLHVSREDADDVIHRMADLSATWHRVHPEIEVTSQVLRGHPGGELTAASAEADLVVVGSRGLGGFRGLALGSASQSLLHHSGCPVMVLPPALLARPSNSEPAAISLPAER